MKEIILVLDLFLVTKIALLANRTPLEDINGAHVLLKGSTCVCACVCVVGCWTGLQDLTHNDLHTASYTLRTHPDPHSSSADSLISQQGQVGRMIGCSYPVSGGIY